MTNRLEGVHPDLIAKLSRVLAEMMAIGYPMIVTDGVRTLAQQQALWAQGRTKPGRIVTNADGVKNKSNHQPHEDGYGHAVDCAFLVGNQPSWDEHLPWTVYGALAMHYGLVWGGSWTKIIDRPHVELP